MKTIETRAVVTPERTLTIQVPEDVEPGEHRVIIMVEEAVAARSGRPPLTLPSFDAGSWPENLSLHRDELYDSLGR